MPRTAKKSKATPPDVKVGDHALIAGSRASMPGNWFMARVLWTDGAEVLIEHTPAGGTRYAQVLDITAVRAVGALHALVELQGKHRLAVRALVDKVHEAESALGAARDAVWAACDKLGVTAPPRFTDAAEHESSRALRHASDEPVEA